MDFREIFHDPLSEMAGYLERQGLRLCLETAWPEVKVCVYAPYIKRLMDNIASNLIKYADPAQPVRVMMECREERALLSVSNAVAPEATGRKSSGIGLSNMEAMMEKLGGRLETEHIGTYFRVTLCFPLAEACADQIKTPESG